MFYGSLPLTKLSLKIIFLKRAINCTHLKTELDRNSSLIEVSEDLLYP